MKIVIDTNVLVAIIGKSSTYRPLFDGIRLGKPSLLISHEVALEYEEILSTRLSPQLAFNLLNYFIESPIIKKVEIFFFWNLVNADEDDNKFMDLALNGDADYLVTNDSHFDELKKLQFPHVKIISLDDFFELVFQPAS
jgi:putative PIN family toxin of toxin-antitoxin system